MPSSSTTASGSRPSARCCRPPIDKSQEFVAGRVRLKLYKGIVRRRRPVEPLFALRQDLVTFEEGAVAYDQRDAEGFIKLNALRLRTLGMRKRKIAGKG